MRHIAPRLKDIGAIQLYAPGPAQAAWPRLEKILKKRPVGWDLIARNYDRMVRYATALRLRTAETDQVLRRFTKGGGPKHRVYLALEELGRAVRTVFACVMWNLGRVKQSRMFLRLSLDSRCGN